MKLKIIVLALAVSALFLIASCAMYMPISQPSGSNMQLNLDKADYTVMGVGEGTACAGFLLGIPTGGENTYKKAVQQAISSKGGDLLIQSSADTTMTYFPSTFFSIFSETCITVQGLVVKLK